MTGTSMVKARERYAKIMERFPERAEFCVQQIELMNDKIRVAGVCRRCGRPLKDDQARINGYGKECQAKAEAEAAAEE